MDKIRIQKIDQMTKVMSWDDKEKVWTVELIILGDFDMEFEGSLQELGSSCLIDEDKDDKDDKDDNFTGIDRFPPNVCKW